MDGHQMTVADNASEQEDENVEHQILVESLTYLYRSMTSAAIGHVFAASFVVFSLYEVVPHNHLYIWLGAVITISSTRLLLTRWVEQRLRDAPTATIQLWATVLYVMTFFQTATWGSSVFVIWPDSIEYRAVLVVILAGIIAAGGIILALHRRSFIVYCLPIAIPATAQLLISGGRLEFTLAVLFVFYSGLMYLSVNRLTELFLEGLRLRFLMQTESRTDALTGLANRRGFDESLHDLWQQANRTGQSLGLLMIDVDHFKAYNDYYGHPQGDVALKILAKHLSDIASRSTDVCARIGGEEFAILMPVTDLAGCRQVADSLQASLEKERVPHRNSDRGYLTVSMGLNVVTPDQTNTPELFMMRADQALYEAKESGRNTISEAECIPAEIHK